MAQIDRVRQVFKSMSGSVRAATDRHLPAGKDRQLKGVRSVFDRFSDKVEATEDRQTRHNRN
jgi:hypothetical protein